MEEKPIECISCKKETTIIYKEIINGKISSHKMCSSCPILKEKIVQTPQNEKESPLTNQEQLLCETCHTTLESFKTEGKVGCCKCYEVFEEAITEELANNHLKLMQIKSSSFHIGKEPINTTTYDPSNQLESLQASLNDALALENYEKAAKIRDAIKTLMDKIDEK